MSTSTRQRRKRSSDSRKDSGQAPPIGDAVTTLSLADRRTRRPAMAAAGALMVAVAGLLGAMFFGSLTAQTSVLVASHDLEPGRPLIAGDFRVAEISIGTGADVVTVEEQASLIGTHPRAPIPAGTFLNPALVVADDERVPAGSVVLGVTLEPGAAAGGQLRTGDHVAVFGVETREIVSTVAPGSHAQEAVLLAEAHVWALTTDELALGGSQVVALLVPAGSQADVAQAAADGRLRLALLSGG